MSDQKKLSRLTLDLPADIHRRLKVAAASQGKSMKAVVLAWIERGLTSHPKK